MLGENALNIHVFGGDHLLEWIIRYANFQSNDKLCDYWHPMGNYKLLNDSFYGTLYYFFLKTQSFKVLKVYDYYKPHKKYLYKTRKTNKL